MKFLSFNDARTYVRSLGFSIKKEWDDWTASGKRPKNIPFNPHLKYKECGWVDWPDFLGKQDYMSFDQCKSIAQSLKFSGLPQWEKYCKDNRHLHLPVYPYYTYRHQWKSAKDFLGHHPRINPDFISYEEAKQVIHPLQISHSKEWNQLKSKPVNIPKNPQGYYTKIGQWIGWNDFLGATIENSIKCFNGEYYKIGDIFIYPKTGEIKRARNKTNLHVSRDGYSQMRVNYKSYPLHRLMYILTHRLSELPSNIQVDHIDQNTLNNASNNLQALSPTQHNLKTQLYLCLKNNEELNDIQIFDPIEKKYKKIKIGFDLLT